jgi:alpha-1,2-mannosyltransferase
MLRTTRTRLLLILAAALAVHAAVIVHRRQSHGGDFDVSRELGRRLLAHEELYAGGLHYPYLPAAALVFAPLALLPAAVGFVLRYLLALASLALTVHWLYLLVRRWDPHLTDHRWRVATATVVLALPYVVRDLDDSGPHLILLALVVGGLTCAARGRDALAAASIGLATAVKATQ